MANAFDNYMRAKQGAMQEGQNMLVMEQAAKKMQRDQKMRDILSGASNSFDPNTLPPTAAGGEVQPPQRFSMDEAMNRMRAEGLGPEAMAYGKSERDIRLKHKLKQELMQDTLSRMGINTDGGMGGGLKSGQTMKMGPRGLEFTFDPSKGAKTKLDREQFEYETGGGQPSGMQSGGQNALSSLPPKMQAELGKLKTSESIKGEQKRFNELRSSKSSRKTSMDKLLKFRGLITGEDADGNPILDDKTGQPITTMNTGAGRKFAQEWLPGVWTKQGRMGEEFNAFAEVAARQALKASGEIRPTDADVKGMKEAMFGVGRDEQVNINLIDDAIKQIKLDEAEFRKYETQAGTSNIQSLVDKYAD